MEYTLGVWDIDCLAIGIDCESGITALTVSIRKNSKPDRFYSGVGRGISKVCGRLYKTFILQENPKVDRNV